MRRSSSLRRTRSEASELVEQLRGGSPALRLGQRYLEYVDLGASPQTPGVYRIDSIRLFLEETEPLARLGLQP
jgi:hypothetical protein